MGVDGQLGEGLTYGGTELYSTRVSFALRSRSNKMGDGKYAAILDVSKLWNILQRCDCHNYGTTRLAKFFNIIGEDIDFAYTFPGCGNQNSHCRFLLN